jgi:GNAT superfamily N-acetyltransferase
MTDHLGMQTVTTRRGKASDSALLAEVALKAYLPYVDRMGGRRPAPMDADYTKSIARDVVWVAEVEEQIVGFLVLVDQPETTLLENVTVHPNWQGRGLGRLLVAIAEDHARATGKGAVRLYTNAAMVENLRLYPHLGYVEVDRRVDEGFDRVFYEKEVSCAGRHPSEVGCASVDE